MPSWLSATLHSVSFPTFGNGRDDILLPIVNPESNRSVHAEWWLKNINGFRWTYEKWPSLVLTWKVNECGEMFYKSRRNISKAPRFPSELHIWEYLPLLPGSPSLDQNDFEFVKTSWHITLKQYYSNRNVVWLNVDWCYLFWMVTRTGMLFDWT